LIAGIVGLGAALQIAVLAEASSEDQWHALPAFGCDYGQGFLFARPPVRPPARPFARPLDAAASLIHLAATVP
jgi:EAL domain-containing protein (putative c-di-GMP-specific phosphodiesterase class I)